MPSGKQLSFAYGEVSPALRFKADAVSYPEGLFQLTNGYVKKAGGLANRQGFKFLAVHDYQEDIPTTGSKAGNTLHTIRSKYDDKTNVIFSIGGEAVGATAGNAVNIYGVDGTLRYTEASILGAAAQDPSKCQVVEVDESLMLTFGDNSSSQIFVSYTWDKSLADAAKFFRSSFHSPTPSGFTPADALAIFPVTTFDSSNGLTPNLPVSYLIMKESITGEEVFWKEIRANLGHPHAQRFALMSFDIVNDETVKRYNVYRSSGIGSTSYAFVGAVTIPTSTTTNLAFSDFVVVADILNGPPINARLWGQGGVTDYHELQTLEFVRRACLYQQRLFIAFDDDQSDRFKAGQIGVSKLGAYRMLSTPEIHNLTGAFDFRMPLKDGDKVVAMVPMERMVVLCDISIFVARGGEQGSISPVEINPLEISSEGCSRTIEPKKVGSQLYYVNRDHTKLMRVVFTIDGNATVEDISIFADHFFNDDISEIEVTKGEQDIVWMVTRTGKLVSVTAKTQSAGFALHETDGFVESICVIPAAYDFWPFGEYDGTDMEFSKRETDILVANVIRDGVRNLEAMVPRVDRFDEGFAYMDSYSRFGARLTLSQDGKYVAVNTDDITNEERVNLNIQAGTTYESGEPLELFAVTEETELGAANFIDFYYTVVEQVKGVDLEVKRTLRFQRNGVATWDGFSEYKIPGFFQADVPAELQDVTAQNPSNLNALQTRYAVPQQIITGLTHLANKDVAVFADGSVLSAPLDTADRSLTTLTVDGAGQLDLGSLFGYGVIGLSYEMTMQSLDLESSENRTLTDANKLISAVGVALDETRGGYFGQSGADLDLENFEELRVREDESFDSPEKNFSGYTDMTVAGSWDPNGRAVIRQVKPLPISVLSVYPKGVAGD